MIDIRKVSLAEDMLLCKQIRYQVFCLEQNVSPEGDWDDKPSENFLIYLNGKAVGTMRYRFAGKVVKIERLSVLQECRGKGLARKLFNFVLQDISKCLLQNKNMYNGIRIEKLLLHSQLPVVEFYESLGFQKKGNIFEEEGIKHYTMTKNL